MLSFVEDLKRMIASIQATGGATIERRFPSPSLTQKLREYAVHLLEVVVRRSYILDDWFNEGFFEEYVRMCVLHLYKLGIEDDDRIYRIHSNVVERAVMVVVDQGASITKRNQESQDFDEQLAQSLFDFFWEKGGDEQTYLYTTAQSRWLIAWDYQKSQWKVTGLGQVFMELSPIQAAIFFLSTDLVFNTGQFDVHHMSMDLLHHIQFSQKSEGEEEEEESYHLPPLFSSLLVRLGILSLNPGGYAGEFIKEQVTPIGRLVLRTVLSPKNPYRDTVLAIIRTEEIGGAFHELTSEMKEIRRLIHQTDLVDEANRESICTSIELYHSQKSLDALRVIYPSIEAIMNTMLVRAGEAPDRFSGLVAKAQHLGQRGIIPPDISHGVEVFTGRNRVIHGNFSPPEDCASLLCPVAFYYLSRLLTDYHPL